MPKLIITKKSYILPTQPLRQMDITQYGLPDDWLGRLIVLCEPSMLCRPITQVEFFRHIGGRSAYLSKDLLMQALKFHYAVLSGALNDVDQAFRLTDDQKKGVIVKINEGIHTCTAGFHARINHLMEMYFLPRTIEELLGSIRHEIVEHTANQATNEVHTNNRFFIIAAEMGYGVHPKLNGDYYYGTLPGSEIQAKLTQAFAEGFQPFATLRNIKNLLITPFDNYTGRNETEAGYPAATYSPGLDYLQQLLGEESIDYEYLVVDEDNDAIRDINWAKILGKVWDLLIKRSYFDLGSWSGYIESFGFKQVGLLFSYVLRENHFNDAIAAVAQVFADPACAHQEGFKKIPYLFSSENECFAYIKCNPALSKEAIVTLLLRTLDFSFENTPELVEKNIWQFVAENPWSEDFGRRFFEKYPEKLNALEYELILKEQTISYMLSQTPLKLLKGLLLKLSFLPPKVLFDSLQEQNTAQKNTLMLALTACKSHPEEMLMWVTLIKKTGLEQKKKLLLHRDRTDNNAFTLLLKENSGHQQAVRELINVILTMPEGHAKNSMLQLNQGDRHNGLLLAIKHCPSAVPVLLRYILTLDPSLQQGLITACLLDPALSRRERKGIQCLLKIMQNVHTLELKPERIDAYVAASALQYELLDALNTYFENRLEDNAYKVFQDKWHASIDTASKVLGEYTDWAILLANIILSIVSIPLLGLPLAVNYYRTGYKRLFFQTNELNQLECLGDTIQSNNEFNKHFALPLRSPVTL